MKHHFQLTALTAGVVLCTAAFVFSADQMSMPMGDSAKAKPAVSAKQSLDTLKHLKPQATCPILGEPIDKKLFVDYKGKRIYVCCEGCLSQVKKDPEKAIKKLASIGEGVETIKTTQKK